MVPPFYKGNLMGDSYVRDPATGQEHVVIAGNLRFTGSVDMDGPFTHYGKLVKNGLPYKTYVARLSQSGINAPVATVLENTLDADVEWGRSGTGRYPATIAGGFEAAKTLVLVTGNTVGTGPSIYAYFFSGGGITLSVFDDSLTDADDRMNGASIEIRVYP